MGPPTWDVVWEVHNLLSPTLMGAHGLNAQTGQNATLYSLLGHYDKLSACEAAASTWHGEAPIYSFTWLLPTQRRPMLRGACYGVHSRRWEPAIVGEAVSGRNLCEDAQEYVTAASTQCPPAPLAVHDGVAAFPGRLARRSAGAACFLAAGGGADAHAVLADDLRNLHEMYRAVAGIDLIAFHDGSLNAAARRSLVREFSTLSFHLLTRRHWRLPQALLLHERFWKRRYTDEPSGRELARWLGIRFWCLGIFEELAAAGYSWLLRLGRGTRLLSPIRDDLFGALAAHGAVYGYRLSGCERIERADFWRLVQRYFLHYDVRPEWLFSHCSSSEVRTDVLNYDRVHCGRGQLLHGMLNVDFFAANVSFFREQRVLHFLRHAVDASAAIWRFNWHEGLWHTVIVQAFTLPSQSLHWDGWSHQTGSAHTVLPRPASDEALIEAGYVDAGTVAGSSRHGPQQVRGRVLDWARRCNRIAKH